MDKGALPQAAPATHEPDPQAVPALRVGIGNAGLLFGNFNTFCVWGKVTPSERRQLAIHLAGYRAARTIEELAHEHLPATA